MKEDNPLSRPAPYILWPVVVLGIASISIASLLIRLADAPAVTIAAYRLTLAALALGPAFLLGAPKSRRPWEPRTVMLTLLSGLFLSLHFVFWIHSLQMTSVASSATLVSTTPLFSAIFSYAILKEPPGRRLVPGIFCTLLGSAFIAGNDFSLSRTALWGDFLALAGAWMATGYLLTGRMVRRSLGLTAYTFGSYGSAGTILLSFCLLTGTPLAGFSTKTYTVLVLLALIPQLIGHTSFNWTLKYLSPTSVAALILGEPIGATLLAAVFLGETVSPLKGTGLAVLCTGIFLSTQPPAARSAPEDVPAGALGGISPCNSSGVEVDSLAEKK